MDEVKESLIVIGYTILFFMLFVIVMYIMINLSGGNP